MGDLYLGFAVLVVLSLAVLAATLWFTRNASHFTLDVLAFCTVGAIFFYINYLWYNPRLLHLLPVANLVIVGNWFPLAAAVLSAVAWRRVPGRVWRKAFSAVALSGAALYTVVWPLRGDAPVCGDMWTADGICLQTTAETCTAACAATLLRQVGIATSEQEMAELCLTRAGTTWQGLYRGLKRKTAGTNWDVEVLAGDAETLLSDTGQPLLLSVGLPRRSSTTEQVATAEWGWRPGVGHSVILLEKTRHGRIAIADPTPGIGREEWTRDDLSLLFRGTAMRLVPR